MRKKVIIIGGGVIGLSVGWQILKKGLLVEIYNENDVHNSAGWVSAGMLAPFSESYFEELTLFNLCKESLNLYERFLKELEEDSGTKLILDKCGTLAVGFNRDDIERMRRVYRFYQQNNFNVEWVDGDRARELEPLLSPRIIAGIWMPDEAQIDNRLLIQTLRFVINKLDGKIFDDCNVSEVKIRNNKLIAIKVNEIFLDVSNCIIIISAGAWSKTINGIPDEIKPPIRPVKGQIITLNMNDSFRLTHMIRAPDVYLTPKLNNRLLIGASNEEKGFDFAPTAGEIMWLLRRAWEVFPSIYDLEIKEIKVGLRPGSPDNAPILGSTKIENLYYATGHYRHGILLTPITAYGMSALIMSKLSNSNLLPKEFNNVINLLTYFQPSRFYK